MPVEHRALDFNLISSSGVSLGERVDRFGIQVRDYGGPAGLKTVSSPTGYSEHILITFDGLNLNSPQNGVFDMSSLPADFFSHGELFLYNKYLLIYIISSIAWGCGKIFYKL